MKIINEHSKIIKEAPEDKKRIVLNFKKAGFVREPDLDFTDDGARFFGYIHKSGMPMTYTSYMDNAFISLRPDYLHKLNYEEYSKLPSYKLADMYNYVPKSEVDMAKLDDAATQLMKEYEEAVNSLESVDEKSWQDYIAQAKELAVEKYNKMVKLVKDNFELLSDNYAKYEVKHVFEYLNDLKDGVKKVDRIASLDDTYKRQALSKGIYYITTPMDDDFYCKQITEIIKKLQG